MKRFKQFHHLFYNYQVQGNEALLIHKTGTNILIMAIAIVGFIACFANVLWLGIIALIFVFVAMTIQSTCYFEVYRKFNKSHFSFEEYGSKYSFKNPKTLLIRKG